MWLASSGSKGCCITCRRCLSLRRCSCVCAPRRQSPSARRGASPHQGSRRGEHRGRAPTRSDSSLSVAELYCPLHGPRPHGSSSGGRIAATAAAPLCWPHSNQERGPRQEPAAARVHMCEPCMRTHWTQGSDWRAAGMHCDKGADSTGLRRETEARRGRHGPACSEGESGSSAVSRG